MRRFINLDSDEDFVKKNAALIEMTLESLGFYTRVVEVNILEKFYEFCLEVALGTDLEELEKHDKDLSLALASPTGKVYWQIPLPGRALIGLKLPKAGNKEYLKKTISSDEMWRRKSLKSKIALIFFWLGETNLSLARKFLGKSI